MMNMWENYAELWSETCKECTNAYTLLPIHVNQIIKYYLNCL